MNEVYFRSHMCFNCMVDLGLGLRLVLGFYSVRHLMNGWDLKYTFSNMAIRWIPMSLNLVVSQNLWASVPYIDVQTGVKHGNPADSQVEKSGPLILYTACR